MYFLLHHATGVLMLQAESREQAIAWSRRQLAKPEMHFSIVAWPHLGEQHEAVERSGTGIREIKYTKCELKVSVVPDAVQRLDVQDGLQTIDSDVFCKTRMESAPTVIH